jgi:hypothetical protein
MSSRSLLIIAAVLLLGLVATSIGWQAAARRAQRESARAQETETRLAALADSLREARAQAAWRTGTPGGAGPVTDDDLASLRRQGLHQPGTTLRRDLVEHPELIPFQGVLGGTMGFYDTSSVFLLNDRWVFARFDDGHFGGSGIFEYRLLPRGRIHWKRVAAKLDR